MEVDYDQPGRSLTMISTVAYAGGLPATWTLDVPDLASAGYDPTWGMQATSGVDWSVVGVGGDGFASFGGGAVVDNAQIVGAGAVGSTTAGGRASALVRGGPMRSVVELMHRVP
jgi:hypothetical protein